ncbi:hypothetical protein FRB90_010223, partial [Tulasnella sp. 427]
LSSNVAVCMQHQQPQAPSPASSRTSSFATLADVPHTRPAPIANPELVHRHHQQAQYHQQEQTAEVEEVRSWFLSKRMVPARRLSRGSNRRTTSCQAASPCSNPLFYDRLSSTAALPRTPAQALTQSFGRSVTAPDLSPSTTNHSNCLSSRHTVEEFNVSVRNVEAIKNSHPVRPAAELHVNVANDVLNSPTSHELRATGNIRQMKQQSAHQTIGVSDPEDKGKDLVAERRTADVAAVAAAVTIREKKPFLGLCFLQATQVRVVDDLPDPVPSFLTANYPMISQCVRRRHLYSFTNESGRGIRKPKPVAEAIIDVGNEEPDVDKNGSKKRTKECRGPIEWIIAVDVGVVCPVAWAAHPAALELQKVKANFATAVAEAAAVADVVEDAAEAATFLTRKVSPLLCPSSRAECCASAPPLPPQLVQAAPV